MSAGGQMALTDIIDNYPEKLAEIKGISKERAKKIGDAFYKIQSMQNIVMFLQKYNISINLALEYAKKEKEILKAAHYYATKWEFDVIYPQNMSTYDIEQVKVEVENFIFIEPYGDKPYQLADK